MDSVRHRMLGVVVSYSAPDGGLLTADLAEAWCVPFERLAPVRALVSYKGQRNFTGSWWCATTSSHVGYESWLERDHLMLLDFASEVVGISSQPFTVAVETPSGRRRHTPDYFARLADGTGVVIDVRPDARVGADGEVFAATSAACELVGWRYERLGDIDPLLTANVRWLAGYRHPRCLVAQVREALMGMVGDGSTVGTLAQTVGEPITVLPTLFHLLWSGELRSELRQAALRWSSPVWLDPR